MTKMLPRDAEFNASSPPKAAVEPLSAAERCCICFILTTYVHGQCRPVTRAPMLGEKGGEAAMPSGKPFPPREV